MAAKKKTEAAVTITEEITTTTEEVVETKEKVDASTEAPAPVEQKRTIIAKSSTPFRRTTSLEPKYIVGVMPVGIPYEIVKEVNSKIYGGFYQLRNGYYISKGGNYSIN